MSSVKNKSHKAKCQAYRSAHTADRNKAKRKARNEKRATYLANRLITLNEKAMKKGYDSHATYIKALKLTAKDKYAKKAGYDNYKEYVKATGYRLIYTVRTGEFQLI